MPARLAVAEDQEVVDVLEADPDLATALQGVRAGGEAPQILAAVHTVKASTSWRAERTASDPLNHYGFLVIDGLLAREVEVLGRRCLELVGPGDVVRPWVWDGDGAHVRAEVGWRVLERTRLGVLDRRFAARAAPWPEISTVLVGRSVRRAHVLAVHLAIAHHPRVRDRVLLTLWHLAERWGRRAPEGVVVPLPLPHARLAMMVATLRPSASMAVGELTREGLLSRRANGHWVLHGPPPAELGILPERIVQEDLV